MTALGAAAAQDTPVSSAATPGPSTVPEQRNGDAHNGDVRNSDVRGATEQRIHGHEGGGSARRRKRRRATGDNTESGGGIDDIEGAEMGGGEGVARSRKTKRKVQHAAEGGAMPSGGARVRNQLEMIIDREDVMRGVERVSMMPLSHNKEPPTSLAKNVVYVQADSSGFRRVHRSHASTYANERRKALAASTGVGVSKTTAMDLAKQWANGLLQLSLSCQGILGGVCVLQCYLAYRTSDREAFLSEYSPFALAIGAMLHFLIVIAALAAWDRFEYSRTDKDDEEITLDMQRRRKQAWKNSPFIYVSAISFSLAFLFHCIVAPWDYRIYLFASEPDLWQESRAASDFRVWRAVNALRSFFAITGLVVISMHFTNSQFFLFYGTEIDKKKALNEIGESEND